MRLCFSTLAAPNWTLDETIDGARSAGLGGIDFRGLGPDIDITRLPAFNEGFDQTLRKLSEAALAMPCLNTSITLVTPASDRWEMMLAECDRTVKLAARSGTPFLRVFGGAIPKELSREEARDLARRHLKQLVKMSRGTSCVLLEMHDAWSVAAEVLELLDGFDPAQAAVLWDIEHPFYRGESPAQTVAALGECLRHVHIKDSIRRAGGRPLPTLLGKGELPVAECIKCLRETGYGGWLCLETEKRWESDAPDPQESLPQFAEFVRRQMRD